MDKGKLGVIGGKVAVAVGVAAGGIDHRLQSQSLDGGNGRLQPVFRHGGGGAKQRHPGAGIERVGSWHENHLVLE